MTSVQHRIAACLIGTLVSAVASAQGSRYMVYGVGNDSCGKWTANRTAADDTELAPEMAWLQGWITAVGYYNKALPAGYHDLREVDSDAVMAWMDNYCRAHPLDDLESAVKQLVRALATK